MTVHFTWFHERFQVLPADATEDTVRIYARAYIMMLLSTQLIRDKSANLVHIRWLPFVANLDDMGRYNWGSAALAWLYRCMCRVANRNVTNFVGPLQLLQSWIFWRFPMLRPFWEPYSALDNRLDSDIVINRVANSGPSAEFLDWWHHETHRVLSPEATFVDPRDVEIPAEAFQRGLSQAPRRSQLPDMPDNWRVERRRRISTRDTGREWRWLDDMMQEDDAGGDGRDPGEHRVRQASTRRRATEVVLRLVV
ncbi:hypothetical protein Ahy_A03g014310 [Arachis hypogaea]|uniref:Aminotransferase-like plant mobile domain-containing protein n=1 Tax=Arachis hypogaea TaxID=3818 RepID=A0A445DXD9_ARAHY|nr:hypothetical protein Ahy_A03g014310 [Arachis hypogaea]